MRRLREAMERVFQAPIEGNKPRCWFSSLFFDIHDYPIEKGGDGFPSHFHTYQCRFCGAEFTI